MNCPRAHIQRVLPWLAMLIVLGCGCSHSGETEVREKGYTGVVTPQPPAFFTGAACVLLTNSLGFSARVSGQAESVSGRERNFSGQLLGLGAKLFFSPEQDESTGKQQRAAGLSFIWDVNENRGYVLSETMQAYAPVSYSLRITNVVISKVQAPPQKLAGYLCESAHATVQKADGTTANFELLRAADLNGFPIRLTSITNSSMLLTLNFTKIRLESPGSRVFEPPDGFTKYSSPEAMVDELAARQHSLKRKRTDDLLQLPGYGSPH